MACLWAARLWEMPEPLHYHRKITLLLRRQEEVQQLREHGGLRLSEHDNMFHAPVESSLISQHSLPITHLLVCTKAQDVEEALASVAHLFNANTCIVLLQNGVKVQQQIARLYQEQCVYALSTSQGAYLRAPFDVIHAGFGSSYLGLLTPTDTSPARCQEDLLNHLPANTLDIHWDVNITSRLWIKFAINCAINALTVIYNCRNGELLQNTHIRGELIALCAEIESIVNNVPQAAPIAGLFAQVETVLLATADNISSTLQDARKGKTTEFAHFNPYLCQLAQQSQTANPVNTHLIDLFSQCVVTLAD